MPDETYQVKINRRDGVLEITGPDKVWIAEQLDKLAVVYNDVPLADPAPGIGASAPNGARSAGDANQKRPVKASAEGQDESPPRRSRGRGSGFRGRRNDELARRLTAEVRGSLQSFVDERRPNFSDGPNQAAILAAFLQTDLDWDTVGANDLYTIYDVMGWPAPNPRNALDNGKTRKNYFTTVGRGRYQLSHTGERFGRHEAKNPPPEKS